MLRRLVDAGLLVGLQLSCTGLLSLPRWLLLPLLICSARSARWQLVPSFVGWCARTPLWTHPPLRELAPRGRSYLLAS